MLTEIIIAIIIAIIIIVAVHCIKWELFKKVKTNLNDIQAQDVEKVSPLVKYKKKYRKKYLLSQNEKNQYEKIKVVTDELGLVLFSKVRLADIIEPVAGIENWKTYWNKIQSKHVDFLICTKNLITLCVLEIDDKSHKRIDRIERDNFVDYILNDVSIEILHKEYINEEELKKCLENILGNVKVV